MPFPGAPTKAVRPSKAKLEPYCAPFGETVGGFQWKNGGAWAEFAAVKASALVRKPGHVTFAEAASVPTSALIALNAVTREGAVRAGSRVLINGAGGALGVFAVQIAVARGAEVTAVDAAPKEELLRSLGASDFVDYRTQDFARLGRTWDVLVDIASTTDFDRVKSLIDPAGRYVLIGHDAYGATGARWLGSIPRMMKLMWTGRNDPRIPTDVSVPEPLV